MTPSPRRRRLFWFGLAASVPLLVSTLVIGWGLPGVAATGMCPAAPPDIAAYTCTAPQYLLRMSLGPWALPGHLVLWGLWLGGVGAVWLISRAVLPAEARPQHRDVDRGARIDPPLRIE